MSQLQAEKDVLYRNYGQMYYEFQNLNEQLAKLETNILECRKAISQIELKEQQDDNSLSTD